MVQHCNGRFTAYDLPPPSYDPLLTQVDKGTPAGELLRRYWHPVLKASDLDAEPRPVRALGEDLVLFRSGEGEIGAFHARCAHRGADLRFGRVEPRGLRCCYHGWLFDARGRCLEQPCEPDGGRLRDRVRQPSYPARELYGLVFIYMGPLDQMPALPRYDVLETLAPNQEIRADDTSIGSGGPAIMPCNWFQAFENVMDPYHVFVLHSTFSTVQFSELLAVRPDISFAKTPGGVASTQVRRMRNGEDFVRVVEVLLPTVRISPHPAFTTPGPCTNISWYLPIDSTHTRIFTALRVPKWMPKFNFSEIPVYEGKSWFDMTEEERRRSPGDFEAQVGQGPITFHSEENLATSDAGVALLRRLYLADVQRVRDGVAPTNVRLDEGPAHAVAAGHTFHPSAETARTQAP
jgi:phenylpropionate dioxygenase-like ring-hydroxylating dioxygenase large terminal subunit